MYTGEALAQYANYARNIGAKYLYGCQMQNLTVSQLDYLRGKFPEQITAERYATAKQNYLGKPCTDCAGLIFGYYPKCYTTDALWTRATTRKVLDLNNTSEIPVGAVLYRSGHVGVYIGNGYEIEARGFGLDVQKRKVNETTFTHYLLFSDFDYSSGSGSKWLWLVAAGVLTFLIVKQ